MARTRARSPLWNLLLALLVAGGVVFGGLFLWSRSDPQSQASLALADAVAKQTGLLLSTEDAALDPASGIWRAEGLALRTRSDAEPVLRARKVELKLNVTELLRGEARIEQATLYGAVLALDLREQAAGSAPGIDRAKLAKWFPAKAEVPEATVSLRTDGGDLDVAGLAITLAREGDAMRGQLLGKLARASWKPRGAIGEGQALALAVESPLAWTAAGLAMDGLNVTTGKSELRGTLAIDPRVRLTLAGEGVALEDFGPMLPAEMSGQGRVALRIEGSEISADLDVQKARLRDHTFDHAKAKVVWGKGDTTLRALELARGPERCRSEALSFQGAAATGTLRCESLMIASALERLGLRVPASGTASGDIELTKGGVRARLELSAPAIGAYRFDAGKLDGSFAATGGGGEPTSLDIEQLELRSKVATMTLSGKSDPHGKLALSGKAQASLAGRKLDIDIHVRGTAEKPETTLELAGVEAARAGYALHAELSGTQLIRGHVELKNADFSERLPAIENAGAPFGRIDARIELTRGALDDLRAFEGQGEIKKLSFGYGDAAFTSTGPFPIALRDGRVQLSEVPLSSGDARWLLGGELDLERGVDLTATTDLPLAPLLATTPFVEAVEGELRVSLALKTSEGALALSGRAEPRAVSMTVGQLKTRWLNLKGRVALEQGALRFQDVAGGFGTGTLTLGGTLALAGVRPKSADLKLALRGYTVSPEERFDVALKADSTLKWSAGDALPMLGGKVTLERMRYARHVQLPEAVIALGRRSKDAGEPTIAIDVRVDHEAPLVVRNDFLDVELEMAGKDRSVRVVGTDAQLGAVGELSVVRGRALFRGATLTVRRGVISFASERRIVPALDLLADAPAKRRPGALIHFSAKGDPNRFDLKLHCDASGSVPVPFTCTYAGDEMTCGHFSELTALWACQPTDSN